MTIGETQAWQIVETFARDLAAELGAGLLSVIVIGSLSGGYCRPGVSDIDAVVVTADVQPVAASLVERLREECRVRYKVDRPRRG
jgi:hypothetical protein